MTATRKHVFTPGKYLKDIPLPDYRQYLVDEKDPTGFKVKYINKYIGKGVFAESKQRTGSFLFEYHGELISKEEGQRREKSYPLKLGSYLFFFKIGRQHLCIDATFSKQIGRFVNDGTGCERNAETRVINIDETPHIAVFAVRNISPGEEIRYDYGVSDLPWRKTNNTDTKKQDKMRKHAISADTRKESQNAGTNQTATMGGLSLVVSLCDILKCSKPFTCSQVHMQQTNTTSFEIQALTTDCPEKHENTTEVFDKSPECAEVNNTLPLYSAKTTSTNDTAGDEANQLDDEEDFHAVSLQTVCTTTGSVDTLETGGNQLDDEEVFHAVPLQTVCTTTGSVDTLETGGRRMHADENSSKSKSPYRKPHRPCPFCLKYQSKLRVHLERKHKNKDEVKAALQLQGKDRDRAFSRLKRKGIMKKNLETMQQVNSHGQIIRERARGNHNLTYCSKCYAFIARKYFTFHKRKCDSTLSSTYLPLPMPLSLCSVYESSEEFNTNILQSLKEDDIGTICRTDNVILSYGRKHYLKVQRQKNKKDERRKGLKTEMRRLALLFIHFKENRINKGFNCSSAEEMFDRSNFNCLEKAIHSVSTGEDGQIKSGLQVAIGYLLKKAAKHIHGEYLIQKKDDKAAEINKFLNVLDYYWMSVFGSAECSNVMKRESSLRRPCNLPNERDIKKLRDFTVDNIKRLSEDKFEFIASEEYIFLRDLVVCRLTLFNARRGGEPSRLQLNELKDALNGVWLKGNDTEEVDDPLEKFLLGRFKIAYQSGKRGKLVPLLLMDDCLGALKVLVDPEIRKEVGVLQDNCFVFPCTQNSLQHVIGWNAVNKCCNLASLENAVSATGMRHHVATVYASLDVPDRERKMFYQHMGHSEEMNVHVYQSPPAINEVTKVGKFLHALDEGNLPSSSCKRSITYNASGKDCDASYRPSSSNSSKGEPSNVVDKDILIPQSPTPDKKKRGNSPKYCDSSYRPSSSSSNSSKGKPSNVGDKEILVPQGPAPDKKKRGNSPKYCDSSYRPSSSSSNSSKGKPSNVGDKEILVPQGTAPYKKKRGPSPKSGANFKTKDGPIINPESDLDIIESSGSSYQPDTSDSDTEGENDLCMVKTNISARGTEGSPKGGYPSIQCRPLTTEGEEYIDSSPTKRRYIPWTKADTDIVRTRFEKYICNTKHIDTNKGGLPVEESAAVPPSYRYDEVKVIPLNESLSLQIMQKQKQEELQAQLTAEKLVQRLNIKMETYNPEGIDMSYRNTKPGLDHDSDDADDDDPDEGAMADIITSDTED